MTYFPKNTTVLRPRSYLTRKSKFYEGNYHTLLMTIDDGSKVMVLLNKQDIDEWENILWITIDLREGTGYYDKSTPPKLIPKPWSRYEIANYATFKQIRNMMSFEIEMELILQVELEYNYKNKNEEIKSKFSNLKNTLNRILSDSDEIFRSYYTYFNLLERRILFEKRIKENENDPNENVISIPDYYYEWLEKTDRYFSSVNFGSDTSNWVNEKWETVPNPDMYKNYFLTKELLEFGLKIKNEPLQYANDENDIEENNWDDYSEEDMVNDAFEGDWQLYRETMDQ